MLVTGSSGLIGSRVIGRAPAGLRLIGFDNHGPPEPPVQAECIPVDLTSDLSVVRAFDRVRYAYGGAIAAVVHLAAFYDFAGEESPMYESLTVRGTERLLGALHGGAFQVGQFIFSSTMLVHAPCEPGQRITEEWPLDPKWPYPRSKVEAERVIRAQRGAIPSVVLRIAGVYDDACESIPLAHQIQRIYERRLTGRVFPGDTSRGQAFVHLDDVVDAIWLAVARRADLPQDTTLLIGEPETLSYEELQQRLAWLIHGEEHRETTRIPKPVAKAGAWVQDQIPGIEEPFIKPWMIDLADDHYELDISRARALLGWGPKRSLRETLPKMIEALKADPAAFYKRNKLEGDPPPIAAPAGDRLERGLA
ncbi:MAG TPA: NAD(P)-dependent oxidoreductase [Phycisphaerales bacterium]|nr:NAD(P)-dependent oxidoreductase [Phycisphaerales bacterium]